MIIAVQWPCVDSLVRFAVSARSAWNCTNLHDPEHIGIDRPYSFLGTSPNSSLQLEKHGWSAR